MISQRRFISRVSLFLFLLFPSESAADIRPLVEFDQMLCLRIGAEFCPESALGIMGGVGGSVFSLKPVSLNLMAVYRFHPGDGNWLFDVEAGVPVAYFDFWEGRSVDWDAHIDTPYAGCISGLSCCAIYAPWGVGLRFGGGLWWEWQEVNGVKGPLFMPVVSLNYRPMRHPREFFRK